ncbi:related to siderophore iron transporter mirc [Serendipita indica DSM 11827]|uniref:Related to siderophore iron transporter mirc n=1 Tax=Serendipita indica (strain DSM 11827) TaxID=1109443 RepID=G4T748_SERID|nr:related to siderophore iron transporter mirc [Serendipita indica DSM 11827]
MPPSFNPVFLPPWVGFPPPKTLSPRVAKQLYDHIRTVAFYLDAMTALVPQTRDSPVQIGLEPIIAAVIPLVGPLIGFLAGLYIVFLSLFFDVSWSDVVYMLFNLCLDAGSGYIPILGNIVDVAFKANLANLAILERHIRKSKYAYLAVAPPKSWWSAWMGRGTANW